MHNKFLQVPHNYQTLPPRRIAVRETIVSGQSSRVPNSGEPLAASQHYRIVSKSWRGTWFGPHYVSLMYFFSSLVPTVYSYIYILCIYNIYIYYISSFYIFHEYKFSPLFIIWIIIYIIWIGPHYFFSSTVPSVYLYIYIYFTCIYKFHNFHEYIIYIYIPSVYIFHEYIINIYILCVYTPCIYIYPMHI